MKLTKILLTVFAVAVTVSCGNRNGFTITGNMGDMFAEDNLLYLVNSETGVVVDSVEITGSEFVFKGEVATPYMAQIVLMNGGYVDLIVEQGSISVNFADMTVSGTPLNDRVNAIENTELQKQLEVAKMELMENAGEWIYDDAAEPDSTYDVLSQKIADLRTRRVSEYVDSLKNVLSSGCDNALGVYAVASLSQWFMFGKDDESFTVDSLETLVNKAGGFVKNNAFVKAQLKNLRDAEKTSVGHRYKDFDAIDFATGKPAKLSDFIDGKLALVDFWASWCGPCRNEICKSLIPLAKKYKGRLQIVGVDVWDNIGDHAAMVEELGITYPQIIDTTENATTIYKISGVPQIMLVAPDGTILARNLFGDEIEKAVRKALE